MGRGVPFHERDRIDSKAGPASIPGGIRFQRENGMWVIFLEAGAAVALLLVIVWATWPKRGGTAEKDRDE